MPWRQNKEEGGQKEHGGLRGEMQGEETQMSLLARPSTPSDRRLPRLKNIFLKVKLPEQPDRI